ncbi:uncharacterized protein L969DRAFT_81683 [Mixia osmundae IAM 14324]|uniref:uncharacterized protein n=1 Tax=Mixia osmundae (strain CBS 9802 / IAM 14324 / JCM 22182 / KY 12970) TaxID=764103 RepID=UPI0004A5559B|nr:uncharacterized protein L969DRAFT_81683 [Mixia osmundae IAM 14324]KEI40835.1 hypothetical protein L969DRAFT_81683 [Mixia osmundae IAM 14324]
MAFSRPVVDRAPKLTAGQSSILVSPFPAHSAARPSRQSQNLATLPASLPHEKYQHRPRSRSHDKSTQSDQSGRPGPPYRRSFTTPAISISPPADEHDVSIARPPATTLVPPITCSTFGSSLPISHHASLGLAFARNNHTAITPGTGQSVRSISSYERHALPGETRTCSSRSSRDCSGASETGSESSTSSYSLSDFEASASSDSELSNVTLLEADSDTRSELSYLSESDDSSPDQSRSFAASPGDARNATSTDLADFAVNEVAKIVLPAQCISLPVEYRHNAGAAKCAPVQAIHSLVVNFWLGLTAAVMSIYQTVELWWSRVHITRTLRDYNGKRANEDAIGDRELEFLKESRTSISVEQDELDLEMIHVQRWTPDDGEFDYQIWTAHRPKGQIDCDVLYIDDQASGNGLPAFARAYLVAGFRLVVPCLGSLDTALPEGTRPASMSSIFSAHKSACGGYKEINVTSARLLLGKVLRDLRSRDDEEGKLKPDSLLPPDSLGVNVDVRRTSQSARSPVQIRQKETRPVFLVGASIGGLVALSYALSSVSTPLRPSPSLLQRLGLARSHISADQINQLARDCDLPLVAGLALISATVESAAADSSQLRAMQVLERHLKFTANGLAGSLVLPPSNEVRRAAKQVQMTMSMLRAPLLLVHGTQDTITSCMAANSILAEAGSADKNLILMPGLRHIAQASLDQQVIISNDTVAWIIERVAWHRRHLSDRHHVRFSQQGVQIGSPSMPSLSIEEALPRSEDTHGRPLSRCTVSSCKDQQRHISLDMDTLEPARPSITIKFSPSTSLPVVENGYIPSKRGSAEGTAADAGSDDTIDIARPRTLSLVSIPSSRFLLQWPEACTHTA